MPSILRRRALVLAVVSAACGRGDTTGAQRAGDPTPAVEIVGADDLSPEVRQQLAEVSATQAAAGEAASAKLLAAWHYAPPPSLEPNSGAKLVAVEMQLDIPGTGFDLDDIDIIDADTKQNYGSDPILQRLTPAGVPVDFDDPEVAADNHHFRLLAVWAVPETVKRIELGYWNGPLSAAIAIGERSDGPRANIEQDASVVAHASDARRVDARIHYLRVECDCSRVDAAPSVQLARGRELLHPTRALAIDATGAPLTTPLLQRPHYGRFAWILEYRSARDATFDEVNRFGQRTALPTREFEPSAAALAALAALPLEGR